MKKIISTLMKTNKILSFFAIVILALAFTSCVQDDDFTVPDSLGAEENTRLNKLLADIDSGTTTLLSIQQVKELYQNQTPALIETNIAVRGYISSSDETGNFFKEIFMQDAPENPTAGIKIIINQVETYNQYNFGREVYIRLTGLFVGEERVGTGVITIGGTTATNNFGTTVKRFTENQRVASIFRSNTTAAMVAKPLTFLEVNNSLIGIFAKFENVEFVNGLNGIRYFDPLQDFDTLRRLQSCSDLTVNFNLETSSFSSFKDVFLPEGNGDISGVISKTFDGSSFVIALNSLDDVNLTGERCTVVEPEGPGTADLPFSEDFTGLPAGQGIPVNLEGWTNVNVGGGDRVFDVREFDGNKYAQTSAFNSNQNPYEVWLVTPGFDLTGAADPRLNFGTKDGFFTGLALKTFVSTDFTGDPTTATWTELTGITYSTGTVTGYAANYVPSGNINLAAYAGQTIYIGFKYLGAGSGITTTYQIDNITVTAN